jgi:hypothetical protein
MVDVVTMNDLAGPPMTAPVVCNDAIAIRHEEEHLRVPLAGAEGPAMMEDDGRGPLGFNPRRTSRRSSPSAYLLAFLVFANERSFCTGVAGTTSPATERASGSP